MLPAFTQREGAGAEKFPRLDVLKQMFPASAEAVRILGADSLIGEETPQCWDLVPFGGEPVDDFLQTIDFFVYFTSPLWQESFGRVIAEAIAAGKVVISNPETAATFGDGVVAAHPDMVDAIVARMIADPTQYHAQVARGQKALEQLSADAFRTQIHALMLDTKARPTATSDIEAMYDIL
ncbi:hypothetical protein ACEN2J_07590 [Pseudorhodobacter sp. W20_MBD10_FR17]|uniref:hypothetical protein n=1 Tax=Pseudorhodobacter sp. W20_MBD10_FR17 TaxID=3240266 RepID=UPI003F9D178C